MKQYYNFLSGIKSTLCLHILFFITFTNMLDAQNIYYVKVNGHGTGSSWNDASSDIQKLINNANINLTNYIFVAGGTYTPGTERTASFVLRKNIKIYGGFSPELTGKSLLTDTLNRELFDRNKNGSIELWEFKNETILSGEIQNDGDSTNNSQFIICNNKLENGGSIANATINGFTIAYGFNNYINSDNVVQASGIKIDTFYKLDKFRISACHIRNNTVEAGSDNCEIHGGGAYISNATLNSCCFSDNSIYSLEITNKVLNKYSKGSGAYIQYSNIDNCSFIKNRNEVAGIGIKGSGIFSYECNIKSSSFVNNVSRIIPLENSSNAEGGGGYFDNCTIIECLFSGNETKNANAGTSIGAGGFFYNCQLIDNCEFSRNKSYCEDFRLYIETSTIAYAGGVYLASSKMTNCTITYNTCNAIIDTEHNLHGSSEVIGGGIFMESSTLSNCTITDNTIYALGTYSTKAYGAGVFLVGGSEIENCTIKSNKSINKCDFDAYNNGAGLYSVSSKITNCFVINNQSSSINCEVYGGGLYAENSVIRNSLFANNSIDADANSSFRVFGGGAYTCNYSYIDNCSFVKNYVNWKRTQSTGITYNNAVGGGVYSSDTYINNSIFWGNGVSGTAQIDKELKILNYKKVANSAVETDGTSFLLDTTNIFINADNDASDGPNFRMPIDSIGVVKSSIGLNMLQYSDWSLTFQSPLVNRGDKTKLPADLVTDIIGNKRVYNDTLDIGPYEKIDEAYITNFHFIEDMGIGLYQITDSSIKAIIPENIDITNTIAQFENSEGAQVFINNVKQISQITSNNFSQNYVYTIISKNGLDTNYVTITIEKRKLCELSIFVLGEGTTYIPYGKHYLLQGYKIFNLATPKDSSVFDFWLVNGDTIRKNPFIDTLQDNMSIYAFFRKIILPVADFTVDKIEGDYPFTVTFENLSTDGDIWEWDFNGDNITDSDEKNPSYTYTSVGTFSVRLIVKNPDGTDTILKTDLIQINRPLQLPEVKFSLSTTTGSYPLTVQFTDETLYGETWSWDFNDDGVIDSYERNPSYTYLKQGMYNVVLTVTNSDGSSTSRIINAVTVETPLIKPVAAFTSNYFSSFVPSVVTFSDKSDYADTWEWDFNGDGIIDSKLQNPQFTYYIPGIYSVRLIVSNKFSKDTLIKTDLIRVIDALANPCFSADIDSGYAPLTVHFNFIQPSVVSIWKWDFENDGVYDAFEENPVFTFNTPGVYSVKLIVSAENYNTVGTIIPSMIIVKEKTFIEANFEMNTTEGISPLTITFIDKSIGASIWNWDFEGDGIIDSYEQNPVFTYNHSGIFKPTLIVSNQIDSDTLTINNLIISENKTNFSNPINYNNFWISINKQTIVLPVNTDTQKLSIYIYDGIGKCVFTSLNLFDNSIIEIPELNTAPYFIQIIDDTSIIYSNIIMLK